MILGSILAVAHIYCYLIAVNIAYQEPGIKELHSSIDSNDKGLQENYHDP